MLLAKYAGKAMPANIFGKAKTVLYAFTTLMSFVYMALDTFSSFDLTVYSRVLYCFFALSAAASVISFLIYINQVFKSKALSGMTR